MCVGVIQTCHEYHRRVRTTTCLSGKLFRLVEDTRDVSVTPDICQGNRRHFGDNTDGSETPLKCQGHQIAVKDTSDLLETVKLCQTPDTSQEHHGHQRPVGDTKDVSGIPHSCLECASQVYSVYNLKLKKTKF